MSFLSRKPGRPGDHGADAGRQHEYDDDDSYAPDGYHGEDDGWSPGEYFSPEGIKGRWAGEHPDGRAGGRGRRGDAAPGAGAYQDGFDGPAQAAAGRSPGADAGYGADEYASGAYDLPEGAEENRPERGRRRRRDREDRTDWTGMLRLRRDRGEDIWPDDGISDEDYWASVASDRPLNGADGPASGNPGSSPAARPAASPRAQAAESRFPAGPRAGDQRGSAGRLGPPPAPAVNRPATGPHATVGVTASRPPAGRGGPRPETGSPASGPQPTWSPAAQPGTPARGTGSGGFPQPPARPTFQPNGYQTANAPTVSSPAAPRRPSGDDRTEQIERVGTAGYPGQRAGGHRADSGPWPSPDQRDAGRREASRPVSDGDTGFWAAASAPDPAPARSGDDPLTSTAYSRLALGETDGRSYRAAARRSQAQTQLTDQTEAFTRAQYQQAQYPASHASELPTASFQPAARRSGEQRQYRGEAPAAAPPGPGGRYPASYGSQPASSAQPGRNQQGALRPGPGQSGQVQSGFGQPGQDGRGAERPGAGSLRLSGPGASPATGPYESQHARPPQRQQAQPSAHPLPAPVYPGSAAPAGASGNGSSVPGSSAATGGYPYPGQPYPTRAAQGGGTPGVTGREGTDDRYYQPAPPEGHASGNPGQYPADPRRPGPGTGGYGNSRPAPGDRPY
jgi:hypothetical protein